jgi:type I restriction enzyme S subunit
LSIALNAPYFQNYILEQSTGSATPIINRGKWELIPIPVAPLEEQKRIVAKVNELMALCDKLEAAQINTLSTHHHLVKSLLATLTQANDADELQTAWQKLSPHFDTLFCTEDSIEQLKQTILQLAVMGKLVKQDPNDEPASKLIAKIRKEKNRLIENGELKKSKELDKISEAEKPFKLPKGWAFERLNNVIDVRDGTHDSPKDATGIHTYPLITSKDFKNGKIDFVEARRISESDHKEISKRSKVDKYDILFSMIGGNIGNQVMVLDDTEFSIKNVALLKYYDKELTIPNFIKKFSENIASELQSRAIGGAQPFVSLGFLRNLVIGLPPVEEQKRIVKKADECLMICDLLKERILKAKKFKIALSEAVSQIE